MKHIKKLNTKGFAHQIVAMAVVVVAVVGGIGSYVYLKSSSALTIDATDSTAQSICGSGYVVADKSIVYYDSGPKTSLHPGVVFLLKNATLKKMCAVTISRGESSGTAKYMNARIYIYDKYFTTKIEAAYQEGNYKYYAGPVYKSYSNYPLTKYNFHASGGVTWNKTWYLGYAATGAGY